MKIGEYTDPKTAKTTKPKTATKALAEGIQEDLKHDVEYQEEASTRAKSYEEILSENDIELDRAHVIVDDLLTKGFHETTMDVTKSTTVTFRTRSHADYMRYLKALEMINPRYVDDQNDLQLRYFLAASLVRFKDHELPYPETKRGNSGEVEEAFTKRLKWIEDQPERLVILLANKLAKFDRDVSIVMSDGVVENF